MKNYSKNELYQIEKAISFLVKFINQFCDNPKPLILHSTKVGIKIYELGAPAQYVIGALLHDLVEDTKCTTGNIKKEFGKETADIVHALTQEYRFQSYKERWLNAERKINNIGKYGWLIKMLDARDNLPYYSKILKSKKRFIEMMWKHQLVIKNSKKYWSNLDEFKEYKKLAKDIIKKWKIKF